MTQWMIWMRTTEITSRSLDVGVTNREGNDPLNEPINDPLKLSVRREKTQRVETEKTGRLFPK